jgi:hypothetical protein
MYINRIPISFFYEPVLVSCPHIHAQDPDSTRLITEDGYIEKMSNRIAVDISFNNAYNIFEVNPNPDLRIVLFPNTPNKLRMKFNYDFLSLGIQFAPDFLPGNGDNDQKGKTRSFEIGTGLVFKHWFTDIVYSDVEGYYLENTRVFDMMLQNGDPFVQFPDLQYKGISVRSGYYHNSKFSFRSLTSQTERQLKSAGSFIGVLHMDYYTINDKSSTLDTQKSNNFEANIGPGYIYNFVFREKFYAALGLQAGLGYMHTRLTTRFPFGDVITNQDNFIFRWDARTGIGYNGTRYYGGLYANVTGTRYKQENTTAVNFETRVFYHLFLGIRLKSPGFLERSVRKVKNSVP